MSHICPLHPCSGADPLQLHQSEVSTSTLVQDFYPVNVTNCLRYNSNIIYLNYKYPRLNCNIIYYEQQQNFDDFHLFGKNVKFTFPAKTE